jgi:hypothetical protein
MILLGIFYVFFIKWNMKHSFLSIDEFWGFFARYNPEIANLFFLFNVLVGVFLISHGIVIMYLSDFILKRKEKLTWVVLFTS